jgi:CTP:molybdopterin cytidylyltransferase MocA
MGRNKLLVNFRGKPLVRHAVETVLAAGITEVFVVLGHEAEKVRSVLADLPVRLVNNTDYQLGLSTSVRAGVNALSGGFSSDRRLFSLADHPWLEPANLVHFSCKASGRDFGNHRRCWLQASHSEAHRSSPLSRNAK